MSRETTRSFLVTTLLLLSLVALCRAGSYTNTRTLIENFEGTTSQISFYNGAEFPGATGSIVITTAGYSGKALNMTFNLSGGNYVAANIPIPSTLTATYNAIAFKTKSCNTNNWLTFRVFDSTGQVFQFQSLNRPFENYHSLNWYEQIVMLNTSLASGSWGGADDGVMHYPLSSIQILTSVYENSPASIANGCVLVDDIYALNFNGVNLDTSKFVWTPFKNANGTNGIDMLSRMGVALHYTTNTAILDAVKNAGFQWIRFKGVYDFTVYDNFLTLLQARGLKVLWILTYSNDLYSPGTAPLTATAISAYANYSRAAAKRYARKGVMYEVYNEADIQGIPTGTQYANLAKATISAIYEGDPSALISTTGLGGFNYAYLREYMQQGGSKGYNFIGLHPYGPGKAYGYGPLCDQMRKFRSVINEFTSLSTFGVHSNYGSVVTTYPPVLDTEWGLSSTDYNGNGLDATALRLHASLVANRMLAGLAMGFPLSVYYDMVNDGTDATEREYNFGLLYADLTEKPAMKAVKQLFNIARSRMFDGYVKVVDSPSLVAMRFMGQSDYIVVIWAGDLNTYTNVYLPGVVSVVNIFGNAVTLSGGNLKIGAVDGPYYATYKKDSATLASQFQ
ncbi:predicted protein [Naegleria gruberi]|uniref:Predicted protein n=1 Tax=Naegleria gruberi TaxID=5762 RepID=D2VEZ4_NAEGR|nr:uncharacterized protein NAEGRDRAFT_67448 [Naegleria gruberi]EFC44591.1 predicted protein [Naegleria gruberi]|eukprot:XP_002677335.1 predicted protein [Naegleria gruberi strain NEG-M]